MNTMDDSKRKTAIKIAAATTGAYALGRFLRWNNKSIVTTEYMYKNEKLPDDFGRFRIAQVSDIQSEYFGQEQSDLIDAVQKTEPDVIVVTGDLLDRNHTLYNAALDAMVGLIAIAPVYYINGNHELALPEDDSWSFYRVLEDIGIHVIFDKTETFEFQGTKINMIGLSEYTLYFAKEEGWKNGEYLEPDVIRRQLDDLCAEKDDDAVLNILLAHEPQYIRHYARRGIDIIFSGHAHGGQFRMPNGQGLYAPGQGVLPWLTSGAHQMGQSTMYISRGLGNSIFPFRLNNRPEIVVVNVEK